MPSGTTVGSTPNPKTEATTVKTIRPATTATIGSNLTLSHASSTVTKVTSSEKDDEVVDVVSVSSTDATSKHTASDSVITTSLPTTGSAGTPHTAAGQVNPTDQPPATSVPNADANTKPTTAPVPAAVVTSTPISLPATSLPKTDTSVGLSIKDSSRNTDVIFTTWQSDPSSVRKVLTINSSMPIALNTTSYSAPAPFNTAIYSAATNTIPVSTSDVITNSAGVFKAGEASAPASVALKDAKEVDKSTHLNSSSMTTSVVNVVPSLTSDVVVTSPLQKDQTSPVIHQRNEDDIKRGTEGYALKREVTKETDSEGMESEKGSKRNNVNSNEKCASGIVEFSVKAERTVEAIDDQNKGIAFSKKESAQSVFANESKKEVNMEQKDGSSGDYEMEDDSISARVVVTEVSKDVISEVPFKNVAVEENEISKSEKAEHVEMHGKQGVLEEHRMSESEREKAAKDQEKQDVVEEHKMSESENGEAAEAQEKRDLMEEHKMSESENGEAAEAQEKQGVVEEDKMNKSERGEAAEAQEIQSVVEEDKMSESEKDEAAEIQEKQGVVEEHKMGESEKEETAEIQDKQGVVEEHKMSESEKEETAEVQEKQGVVEEDKMGESEKEETAEVQEKQGVVEEHKMSESEKEEASEVQEKKGDMEEPNVSESEKDEVAEIQEKQGVVEEHKTSESEKEEASEVQEKKGDMEEPNVSESEKDEVAEIQEKQGVVEEHKTSESEKEEAAEIQDKQGDMEEPNVSESERAETSERGSEDQEMAVDVDVKRVAETEEKAADQSETGGIAVKKDEPILVLEDKRVVSNVINDKQERELELSDGSNNCKPMESSGTVIGTKSDVISEGASEVCTMAKDRLNEKLKSPTLLSSSRSVGDVIAKLKENDFEVKASVESNVENPPLTSSDTQVVTSTVDTLTSDKRSLVEETQRILNKLLHKSESETKAPLSKSQNHSIPPAEPEVGPSTTLSSTAGTAPELKTVNPVLSAVSQLPTASITNSSLPTERNTVMPPLAQTKPVQIKVSVPSSSLHGGPTRLQVIGNKVESQQPVLAQQSMPTVQLPLLAPTVPSLSMPPLAHVQPLRPSTKAPTPAVPKLAASRPVAIAPAPASTQTGIPIGLAASQISNAAVLKALATGNAFQSGGIQIIQASPGQFIIRSNVTNTGNQQQNQRAVLLGNTAIMLSKVGTGGQADGSGNIQKTMQNIQAGNVDFL